MATKTTTKKKTTKKKAPAYKGEAKKLANAQYAGTIEQLGRNKGTNRRQYDEYVTQRQEALGKQLGSDRLATEITGNVVSGLKGQSMAEFDRVKQQNDAARQLRDQATSAANSNALANYEAEMKARGISEPQAAAMKANLETQQGYTQGLDAIDRSYQDRNQLVAGQTFDTQKIRAQQLGNVFEANARATATSDFNEKYNTYVEKRDALAAEISKAKLDRGATYLNTYLTMKKEAQQRAAEKAANQLSASVAMGKQASSDYFDQIAADQAQQRIGISQQNANRSDRKYLTDLQNQVNNFGLSKAKAIAQAKKDGVQLPDDFWDKVTGTGAGAPKTKTERVWDSTSHKYVTRTRTIGSK